MIIKANLIAAALGGAVLAAGIWLLMRPGAELRAQNETTLEGVLTAEDREEDFLRVTPPEAAAENADLVPHATPDEAAAIADDFFARPAPTDAELEAMAPFTGTENIRIQRCSNYAPQGVMDELILAPASPDRRMKSEIYYRLNINHVLSTRDCTCRGKSSPWEPVSLILDEVKMRHGEPTGLLFSDYVDESIRLVRTVERLCKGRF